LLKIRIYTKKRHIEKIKNFCKDIGIDFEIYTISNDSTNTFETTNFDGDDFDLGISYCYPRKILSPLLTAPKQGFINFHPGKLPEYKAPDQSLKAIENKEVNWGVSVHEMNEKYDSGKIIETLEIKLHEPPTDRKELMAITHYFLFELFKNTLKKIIQQN